MTRSFDAVVLGGNADGLVAAIELARAGCKVLLLESDTELGGTLREIEFARGFRAAPLADVGYLAPEVLRLLGNAAPPVKTSGSSVVSLGSDGHDLALYDSIEQTVSALARVSPHDAERWPAFARRLTSLAGFLETLYRAPPPQVDADSIGEYFAMLRLGRRFRRLGRTDRAELLRTLPMALADLLDDWFDSPALKGMLAALGVRDTAQGPMSGGTAFTLLHHHVGAACGNFGDRLQVQGGPIALVAALAQRARALNVTIETASAAREILVRGDEVAGLLLESGEEIICRTVISSLDPRHSLLGLVDPMHLDPEFVQAVRHIRFRGVVTKVLVALDALPDRIAAARDGGIFVVAPSINHVERAYDAVKYGRASEDPFIELRIPSLARPDLAPAGKHVAVLHIQYTPYELREESWTGAAERTADRAIALVDEHVPGFAARAHARAVLAPPELEARFGLPEGAVSCGEMMLDQILFMRPVAGWSRYAMPVPGLYLCGAGTHPGAGITGLSGHHAARAAQSGLRTARAST